MQAFLMYVQWLKPFLAADTLLNLLKTYSNSKATALGPGRLALPPAGGQAARSRARPAQGNSLPQINFI